MRIQTGTKLCKIDGYASPAIVLITFFSRIKQRIHAAFINYINTMATHDYASIIEGSFVQLSEPDFAVINLENPQFKRCKI